MALYGSHPPIRFADNPADPVWRWFILNGPHGERFQWEQFGNLPRDIEYLRKSIDEKTASDPEFATKARQVSLKALDSGNDIFVRTAIQILTVLGTDEDMEVIKNYLDSENDEIAKDAKCSLFERGIKAKRRS